MVKMNGTQPIPFLFGKMVNEYEVAPRIVMNDTPGDVLMRSESLRKVFLKATERHREKCIPYAERKCGIYHYGKAQCEVTRDADKDYIMEASTNSFDGLEDLNRIRFKILAGKISPTFSYEEEQARKHPLEILRQLLAEKSLTKIQRFFLSWRLSRS
jgi:hypothetical protein